MRPGTTRWFVGWLIAALLGAAVIVRVDIAQRREAFRADARVAHRLLSQRAAQQEAILDTLTLLQPGFEASAGSSADAPERRLPALYPQIVAVLRHDVERPWPPLTGASSASASPSASASAPASVAAASASALPISSASHLPGAAVPPSPSSQSSVGAQAPDRLQAAEDESRRSRRVTLGPVNAGAGQFVLVSASTPASFAIVVDARRMVPWDEWPVEREGPVHVTVSMAGALVELQPGQPPSLEPAGLTAGFVFSEALSSTSQPFVLTLQRATGPVQWPWTWLMAWLMGTALVAMALAERQRSLKKQRRAEELLRIGQIARLGTLGELAGGMAHELNQPLAAMLAGTQAARRLLAEDPPELEAAMGAMEKASGQARRAADVVARLRRLVEAPAARQRREPVSPALAARSVIDLLSPQLRTRSIVDSIDESGAPGAQALADPVALEQIIHNLVNNAMQALDEVPASERRLAITVRADARHVTLAVSDTGPGLRAERMDQLFQPFHTTREGGLGLGLSLSQSLAEAMDGTLTARHATPRGAEFVLVLPRFPATT